VEFHDLAGDGGFEGGVVVFPFMERFGLVRLCVSSCMKFGLGGGTCRVLCNVHGRSGNVALPRMNCELAGLASLDVVERVRRALRAAEGRRRMVAILQQSDWILLTWCLDDSQKSIGEHK